MDTYKLFTFEVSSEGAVATFAGITERDARAKAALYHPYIGPTFAAAKRCICASKSAKSTREGGWLICERRACGGYIG